MATRILIADDHEFVRRSLRVLLESCAHDWEVCGEARDGREAVTKAQKLHPDLIILDWVMPGGDGLQAAREILKATPSTRIVMHTLHHGPEIEIEARKVGVENVVSKTDGAAVLIHTIESLLSEKIPAGERLSNQRETAPATDTGLSTTTDDLSYGRSSGLKAG
ncbi:MAG TPA: response regulator transcription factor [Terriglobales bacterium]|nr:response regulator transcription factor [Terriglobales bacterium]